MRCAVRCVSSDMQQSLIQQLFTSGLACIDHVTRVERSEAMDSIEAETTICPKKVTPKFQNLNHYNYGTSYQNYDPLTSFNYRLSGTNTANFNKIHRTVSEQQLFTKWNSKTEFSNMVNTD